ncbi:MAG TPA: hypothetical protein VFZ61_23350, partial [Polyangiales bacterium]
MSAKLRSRTVPLLLVLAACSGRGGLFSCGSAPAITAEPPAQPSERRAARSAGELTPRPSRATAAPSAEAAAKRAVAQNVEHSTSLQPSAGPSPRAADAGVAIGEPAATTNPAAPDAGDQPPPEGQTAQQAGGQPDAG